MSYKLFFDDVRQPPDDTWVVIRTVEGAKFYITAFGMPEVLSLDYDIGYQINETVAVAGKQLVIASPKSPDAASDPTGEDLAKWIVERVQGGMELPDNFRYFIHSGNEEGAEKIMWAMKGTKGRLVIMKPQWWEEEPRADQL
jgi:hypothetical protein